MNHVMLDIDGTLIQSYEFDEKCFIDAVREVTGLELKADWENYPHVTDRGILKTFISRQAPHYSLSELEKAVKPVFTRNIQKTIDSEPALEVGGAIEFVSYLRKSKEHLVSVATGGWGETAKLKLESAGFETDGLILASSNDHHSRIEIMNTARLQADSTGLVPVTYFGDAAWDVKACETLGVNLVVVGNRVKHHQQIKDFAPLERVLDFVDK
ncbi:HAD family hydrolase [Enterovibrio coralii]|uniref:Haloacid dehalogenase n=1 Tax=Enterovibrio coralii TaxID=294935 RepID=A0A135ICS0_9GAMM|nr:HAD family hydrolase [Enterovibrio coralii]KXF83260.1 haloacid dehalogenase [Enterovibrio coralii]